MPHDNAGLQAVMFDMDGLLVDTEPIWFAVESEVMARLGGTWSRADQAKLIGGSLTRSVSYLLAKAAPPGCAAGRTPTGAPPGTPRERPPAVETVAQWLVDGMVARIAANGVTLLPGAAELLAEVAAAGLPCALVTSSERPVMDAVLAKIPATAAATGLSQRTGGVFHATVCAADVTRPKPDPEPYLLAAARLGADPSRCVVLEDAPNGVAAAQAAGCLVVAVPSLVPVTAGNGRAVVRSLREVSVPWMRELAASWDPSIPQ